MLISNRITADGSKCNLRPTRTNTCPSANDAECSLIYAWHLEHSDEAVSPEVYA